MSNNKNNEHSIDEEQRRRSNPPIEVKQTRDKRTENKYYSKMESRDFIVSFILFFQQIADIHFVLQFLFRSVFLIYFLCFSLNLSLSLVSRSAKKQKQPD